jgi:hypothetical protein
MSHSLVVKLFLKMSGRDGGEAAVIILRSQTTNYLRVASLLKIEPGKILLAFARVA